MSDFWPVSAWFATGFLDTSCLIKRQRFDLASRLAIPLASVWFPVLGFPGFFFHSLLQPLFAEALFVVVPQAQCLSLGWIGWIHYWSFYISCRLHYPAFPRNSNLLPDTSRLHYRAHSFFFYPLLVFSILKTHPYISHSLVLF